LDEPRVFGGYLLLEALGRGAMGDVFLARPTESGRGLPSPIVVKRLHGELTSSQTFVARFKHEAAVAVCVDNPHVARAYDAGSVGDSLYIALEYVPGWPLSNVLDAIMQSGRHASVASVIDLLAGGLEGLHALHTAKDQATGRALDVVHRDLSPKNLMVDEQGSMRLIDLGLGKSNAQEWRTRTGAIMGSVGYMAPEQARGERVDARADVYAMAVVAFEMLALRNYIPKASVPEMVHYCTQPTFYPPSQFRSDVPKAIDHVLARALHVNPEHRYASAAAFLEALRAVVPPSRTSGTMVALLDEIFGDQRAERQAKLARLMALPNPEDFESRPTQVFVMRDGVVPQEEILVRTMHVSRPVSYSAAPSEMLTAPVPTTPQPTPPTPKSVGMGTLIGAVLAAGVIGGAIAVVVVLAVMRPQPAVPAPTQVVLPTAPALAAPSAPTVTSRPAAKVAERVPTKARTKVRKPRRVAPESPPPIAKASPPKAAPKPALSLDARLDQLEVQATRLRQSAQDGQRKAAATKILVDIALWRRSKDPPRKEQAVRQLKARLRALR